jgi:hypothetical protein
MSFLWIALGMILRVNIGFGHAGGRARMIGAVRQAFSTSFTLLSFSSATQRQLAGEPAGWSPLWLSPPY